MFGLAQAGTLRPRPGHEIQSALVRITFRIELAKTLRLLTYGPEAVSRVRRTRPTPASTRLC